MKITAGLVFLCSLVVGLSSCNLPFTSSNTQGGNGIEVRYETVSALLTKTAQLTAPVAATAHTPQPGGRTETPRPSQPVSIATATASLAASGSHTGEAAGRACDLAASGRPIDVTIPDDTRFYPNETFSKTWRLVNAGSCSWAEDYAVVWFSGADLGVGREQPLNVRVAPGQTIDVTVDMVAPLAPGNYQSNWKMRNSQGLLFGIGANGDAPFWARIVVIPIDTPTATPPLPTSTPTPAIFASGSLTLPLASAVDLDKGSLDQGEQDDLAFYLSEDSRNQLGPVNGARTSVFGVTPPSMEDCFRAVLNDVPLLADELMPGTYLCYRTGAGLPGWVLVREIDLDETRLKLDFLTWGVP